MAPIYRDPDGMVTDVGGFHLDQEEATCDFCGKAGDAHWSYPTFTIVICRKCAFEILPAMLADTLMAEAGKARHAGSHHRAEQEILTNFWKGAAKAYASRPSFYAAPCQEDE